MKKINALDHHLLTKGDLICARLGLQIVTDVSEGIFYSAPLVSQLPHDDEPRRSTHWAGCFNSEDEIIIFDSFDEFVSYSRSQIEVLKKFYEL